MDERLERRKNINRGYRKLKTWQMAIELYAFLSSTLPPFLPLKEQLACLRITFHFHK